MRYSYLFVLSLITLLIVELTINFFFEMSDKKIKTFLSSEYILKSDLSYQAVVRHHKEVSAFIFKEIINRDEILSVISRANEGDEETKVVERKKLFTLLNPIYKRLKDDKEIKQLKFHFYLPDNRSFLRFHRPEKYGDSLSKTRFSVVKVNETKKYVEGFEEGKIFNGFRFIEPLFYEDKYIGSVGLSIGFESFHNWIEKTFNGHHVLMIKKDVAHSRLFEDEKTNSITSLISEEYVYDNKALNSTLPHTFLQKSSDDKDVFYKKDMEQIDRLLSPLVKDRLHEKRKFVEWVNFDDKLVGVVFLAIKNIKGEHAGYIMNYFIDNTLLYYQKYYSQVLLYTLLFPVVIWVVFLYIGYLRNKENEQTRLNTSLLEENFLIQESRMESMGSMLGNIAHHWRQPLNALGLVIQDIEDAYSFGEVDDEYIKSMTNKSMYQINYMSKTIDEFRNVFESDDEREEFDIVEVINHIIKKQNRGIVLNNNLQGESILFTYKEKFEQIIEHLLSNAIDATSSSLEPKIVISLSSRDSIVEIVVEDNGEGIKKENIKRVFDPYFTTKDEGEGVGMGLYIVKVFLENYMHATIKLLSTQESTSFVITLNKKFELLERGE